MADIQNVYKVKLTDSVNSSTGRVTFDVTPDVIENTNVNYKSIDPVHAPGQIFIYSGTSSRTFNISNARFISRTQKEASRNLIRLQLLRSWTRPVFGKEPNPRTEEQDLSRKTSAEHSSIAQWRQYNFSEKERAEIYGPNHQLGRPPEVLLLSAYSKTGGKGSRLQMEHLNRIPVVINQISIPYPSDVDYIPTLEGVPMPTIMTLDMTLIESHAPVEYENFNIEDYRNGVLPGF